MKQKKKKTYFFYLDQMYKIFLIFLLFNLASCDKINSTQSIIFLVPKNSKDIYQLNEESQFKLNKVERKGWLIKSNQN